MNSTRRRVAARPLLRYKRTTSTVDELDSEVENQLSCNTKNDHHDRGHCPAKRQRCDPSRILAPRVVIDKQSMQSPSFVPRPSSVQAPRNSPSWKQPQVSLAEEATSENHSMGWFVTLPIELLHVIFELLKLRSLSLISMTSRNMSTAALAYLQSARGLNHVMPMISAGHRTSVDPMEFRGVAKLIKCVTSSHSIDRRLKTASYFLNKLESTHDALCATAGMSRCYECFGQLFIGYVSQWSEQEKDRAYCLVNKIAKLDQRVESVLRVSPNVLPWHEWNLRQVHRFIFLEPSTSEADFGLWLTKILKPHPITHQARLLYILTGPVYAAGTICWTYTTHSHASCSDLKDLGHALRVLLTVRAPEWSADTIISIFDELIYMPMAWCMDNVATLLMWSGSEVTQAILGNWALMSGELNMFVYALAHVCAKQDREENDSQHLRWYIEILNFIIIILPKQEKNEFLSELTELFEFTNTSDESDYIVEQFLTKPLLELFPSHFVMIIACIFLGLEDKSGVGNPTPSLLPPQECDVYPYQMDVSAGSTDKVMFHFSAFLNSFAAKLSQLDLDDIHDDFTSNIKSLAQLTHVLNIVLDKYFMK